MNAKIIIFGSNGCLAKHIGENLNEGGYNLKKISTIEKGKISEAALKLIAKASEGSVRDSLSLLDRALVDQNPETKEISETSIRKMLGIADRSKILDLLQFIFKGDQNNTTKQLREMIEEGIEPQNFLNDLLEIIYFLIQKKNIGSFESDLSISESEIEKINLISKDIEVSTLMIFWQFILKGLDELSIVGNQILSLEMLITRLIHLKDMPSYETIVNTLSNNNLNATEENIFVSQDKKIDLKEKNKINEKNPNC